MGQTTRGKEWQLGRQLLLWAGFPSLILLSAGPLCSFVHEELEARFQSPTKRPPASQRCASFWRQTPWGRRDGSPSKSGVCACGTMQPDWHLPENARRWRSDESRVVLSTCDRREGAWRRCVEHLLLPATTSSVTSLARGQWLSGEAQTSICCPSFPNSCCWDETLRTIIKCAGELWVAKGA